MSGASSNAEQRAARRLGTVLRGKYTLERVLGLGGMGAVYLGVHRNGNRVAVKILHPELTLDDDVQARFLREGYVANSIGHAGAVRVLDDDIAEDGAAFLVMELLEGETLEQRRARLGGRLPVREVLALGHQLLDVLAAAHAKGVVHRDIKPENLFLTRGRELKILDFGIARLRDAPGAAGTSAGTRLGTPAFMPPEQALGRVERVGARSDVWAAGATLFTLCSGRFVHEADGAAEIVVRTATQPAPSLATKAPDLPAALVALVDRALAFAPEDRWASADAMRDAIAVAFGGLFGEALSASAIGEVPGPAASTQEMAGAPTLPAESNEPPVRRADPSASTLRAEPAEPAPQATGSTLPSPPVPSRRWTRLAGIGAIAVAAAAGVALLALRRPVAPAARPADSSGAAAARPGCTSARACVAERGGKPAICRKDDGVCVPLESEDCRLLAEPGDVGSDATIWIGAMFPTSGADAPGYGPLSVRAVDLARRDFVGAVGGLPPVRPGAPKRPIGVVACDDRAAYARAATHLVDEVRVPAVIGFARSREVLDLAASHFGPRGVLALAANTASMLRDIPRAPGQPRLVWRVTTSADMVAAPSAALLSEVLEPGLRKGALRRGEPLRLALVRIDNASGVSYAQVYAAALRFNGKSALENGDAFRQVLVPDQVADVSDPATARRVADEILAHAPHVVLDAGGLDPAILREVEAHWPAAATRPRWMWDTITRPDLAAEARARPDLCGRMFGVDTASSAPAISKFALRYNEVFSPKITAVSATAAPYDAFYLVAFAAAALGEQPITGTALARAIPRLVPPGEPVEVGPSAIYAGLAALSAGRNIDLQGAITTLDFDLETGDATADFAVFCLDACDRGEPRAVESGLVFGARTRKLGGSLRCPAAK